MSGEADLASTSGDGFELVFGYRDEQAYSDAIDRSSPTRSPPASRRVTPRCGAEDAESEAGKRLAWVGLAQESRPLVDEITGLRDLLADRGMSHVALCGMGGSSLAPEVICAANGVELHGARLLGPRLRPARPGRPSRAHRGGRVEQVRRHRRDRQPEARLREGVRRRRLLRRRPHGGGDRPGLAAGRVVHGRRLPRSSTPIPMSAAATRRSPRSGWCPVAWPAPIAGSCSTRRPRSSRCLEADSPDNPGLRLGALLASPTRRVSTRWCSPTRARASPGSATGPSS